MSLFSSPSSSRSPALRLVPGLVVTIALFSGCHHQARAADPHAPTPTPAPTLLSASPPRVDVEVEERAADKSVHVAKLGMLLTDGHGKVSAKDGDARYELSAHTVSQQAEPRLMLSLHWQTDRDFEVKVESSITARDGKVIVSQISRADGRTTTVSAQLH